MKVPVAIAICVAGAALLSGAGFAPRQTKAQKPATKPATKPPQKAPATLQDIGPRFPDFVVPNPFPVPLARPEGTVDDVAATLARIVLAGGSDALPALERAALECGFAIHNKKGEELFKPEDARSVGVTMLDFDLATAAELTKRKEKASNAALKKMAAKFPALKEISLTDLFAATTREYGDLDDEHPSRRFFGQFVQALGSESNGEFNDPMSGGDADELCATQVTWLLYMASAQATVATSGKQAEPKEDEQPAEDPRAAEEPPPHGPSVSGQIAQAGVIANLSQALQLTSQPEFQQRFQQAMQRGAAPNAALLEMCRRRAAMLGMQVKIIPPDQIVRTKTFGQKGGSTELLFEPYYSIPSDIRQRYQAAMAEFPNAVSLPNDGPVESTIDVIVPDECERGPIRAQRVANEPDEVQSCAITARTQTRHLGSNPLPEDLDRRIRIEVDTPYGYANYGVPLRIRDWIPAGMHLAVSVRIKGGSTLRFPDSDVVYKWSINRLAAGAIDLTELSGAPFLHPAATDYSQYVTWLQYPGNPNYEPSRWAYQVNDSYTSKRPKSGCAAKPGATESTTQTVKDRAGDSTENKELKFTERAVEIDTKGNMISVQAPMPTLPVITQPGDMKSMMRLFENIKVAVNAPNEVGDTLSVMNLVVPSTKGSFTFRQDFPMTGMFDSLGNGDKRVQVLVRVDVTYKAPPPSEQAHMTGWRIVPRAATDIVSSLLSQSSEMPSREFDDLSPIGRGPLWVSDPSAATCSEIDIADRLPLSMMAQ